MGSEAAAGEGGRGTPCPVPPAPASSCEGAGAHEPCRTAPKTPGPSSKQLQEPVPGTPRPRGGPHGLHHSPGLFLRPPDKVVQGGFLGPPRGRAAGAGEPVLSEMGDGGEEAGEDLRLRRGLGAWVLLSLRGPHHSPGWEVQPRSPWPAPQRGCSRAWTGFDPRHPPTRLGTKGGGWESWLGRTALPTTRCPRPGLWGGSTCPSSDR